MAVILLIDDNTSLVRLTTGLLSKHFPDSLVVAASCCEETRSLIATVKPDVVLLDWELPDGSALSLIGDILAAAPKARFIVVTGHQAGELFPRPTGESIVGVLTKPWESNELVAAIQTTIESPDVLSSFGVRMFSGHDQSTALGELDRHKVRNKLGGVLAGLRAMEGDLHANAIDPKAVHELTNEYISRLTKVIADLAAMYSSDQDKRKA